VRSLRLPPLHGSRPNLQPGRRWNCSASLSIKCSSSSKLTVISSRRWQTAGVAQPEARYENPFPSGSEIRCAGSWISLLKVAKIQSLDVEVTVDMSSRLASPAVPLPAPPAWLHPGANSRKHHGSAKANLGRESRRACESNPLAICMLAYLGSIQVMID